MRKKRVQGLAPSTVAASKTSSGMFCSPAVRRMAVNPTPDQAVITPRV